MHVIIMRMHSDWQNTWILLQSNKAHLNRGRTGDLYKQLRLKVNKCDRCSQSPPLFSEAFFFKEDKDIKVMLKSKTEMKVQFITQ